MADSRNLTIRLNAGDAEGLDLGEIHLIVATHSPHNGSREVFRSVSLVAPSEVAPEQPRTVQNVRALLAQAVQNIDDAEEA